LVNTGFSASGRIKRGVRELRALGFVHGHGVHRFNVIEPAGQHEAHPAAAIVTWKRDAQGLTILLRRALWQTQRDADVAVHQAQTVVVARHQYRTAFVPLLIALDQLRSEQRLGDALVQSFDAPRPFTHGAKQLELIERIQHLSCPVDAARVVD
jgi:hypothetical protein